MKKILFILLLFLVGTTYGQRSTISRSNWNSAKIDAWATPPGGVILNGVDQYYSTPDNANLDPGDGDFSFTCFFKTSSADTEYLLSKGLQLSSSAGYGLQTTSGKLRLLIGQDGTRTALSLSSNTWNDGNWHYAVGAYDRDGDAVLRIDGIVEATDDISSLSLSVSNSAEFSIGRNPAGNYFKGEVIFSTVHNHVLTQVEVDDAFNNGEPHLASTEYKYVGASQTDLLDSWDFQSGWTDVASTIDDSDSFTTVSVGGIYTTATLAPADNKLYRLTYDLTTTSSGGAIRYNSSGVDVIVSYGTGSSSGVVEFSAIVEIKPFLRNGDGGITDVTTLELVQIGEVLNLPYNKAGVNGWVDISGNELHANSAGDPIAVMGDWDVRTAVSTSEVELVTTQKAGYRLIGVDVFDNSGSANTYFIGTSTGNYDIASGVSISANGTKFHNINQLSLTNRSLFIKSGASSCDFILSYVKVQ